MTDGSTEEQYRSDIKGFGYGFRAGFLKLAILKILSQNPMHGYAIMKEIERITENSWRPSPGSIYPALQELQNSGLIIQKIAGRKRIYEITLDGKWTLDHTIEEVRSGIRTLNILMEYKVVEGSG